jgi:DNA-binding response OmpR family regulator
MSIPKNILVIDDEIQIRRMLKIGLEDSGYSVFEAEDGKQGNSGTYKSQAIDCSAGLRAAG